MYGQNRCSCSGLSGNEWRLARVDVKKSRAKKKRSEQKTAGESRGKRGLKKQLRGMLAISEEER